MAREFRLEILTPDRPFYQGNTTSLIIPILDGMYGVEYGHEPVVTAIVAGELRYRVGDVWYTAAVGQGFAEVQRDYVVLLVSSAERPEEIDSNRAQRAMERAKEELRCRQGRHEYLRSQAALARATARLKVKG